MNVDSFPKIKVYAVTRYPEDDELVGYRISSCHQDFIKRIILKYQISSEYPQRFLVKIGMSVASKLVDMEGVPTHIFVQYFSESDGFHYFSYPDTQDCIEWFEKVFISLVDIYSAKLHKRVHKTG